MIDIKAHINPENKRRDIRRDTGRGKGHIIGLELPRDTRRKGIVVDPVQGQILEDLRKTPINIPIKGLDLQEDTQEKGIDRLLSLELLRKNILRIRSLLNEFCSFL